METQKIKVSWDTDGETVTGLPGVVHVPRRVEDDDISDWLSDQYGWCIFGWNHED